MSIAATIVTQAASVLRRDFYAGPRDIVQRNAHDGDGGRSYPLALNDVTGSGRPRTVWGCHGFTSKASNAPENGPSAVRQKRLGTPDALHDDRVKMSFGVYVTPLRL